MSFGSSSPVVVTRPNQILLHEVSDEDLTILETHGTDPSVSWMQTCIGATIGSIPGIIGFVAYLAQTEVIQLKTEFFTGMVSVVIVTTGVITCVICHQMNKKRKSPAQNVIDKIRARDRSAPS